MKQKSLFTRANFQCAGSDCPRTCCIGWDQIIIDQETLDRWYAVDNVDAREELLACLDEKNGERQLSCVDKSCTAQTENGLCGLQVKYGEAYIPKICREFPRLDYDDGCVSYQSLSFSCPVVVNTVLFDSCESLYISNENNDLVESDNEDRFRLVLDEFLEKILLSSSYALSIRLYFIADMFSEILKLHKIGNIPIYEIESVMSQTEEYLSEIKKAVKQSKLSTHPVTSGSFWKTIYEFVESRGIDKRYIENDSSLLKKTIRRCDDSPGSYGKIYSVIKQYKKKSIKHIRKYDSLFERYATVLFVNKGFSTNRKIPQEVLLVEVLLNVAVLQLLVWIEINKNGYLDENFIKTCIVEVDRKSVHSNAILKRFEEDAYMMQLEKYCTFLLDVF